MHLEGVGLNSRALEWRDLSEQEIFNERALKIGLAVGALILAIGMAIAIYYCCTTTHSFTGNLGEMIEESNAPISGIPVVLGSAGFITLLSFVGVIDIEKANNGFASENTPEDVAAKKLQLETATLEDIYKYYYRKNGGLGPLVRDGILTPDQGDQLRLLLSEYHTPRVTTSTFEKLNKTEELNKLDKDTLYGMAKQKKGELEGRWKEVQGTIKDNTPEGL